MSRARHAARRTTASEDRYLIAGDTIHPHGRPPMVVLTLTPVDESGRHALGAPVVVPMGLGEAYDVGLNLVRQVEALLAGAPRPWDGEPGRAPFFSRPRTRTGTGAGRAAGGPEGPRAAAADRRDSARARTRPPRSDYPRQRRSVRGGEQGSAP